MKSIQLFASAIALSGAALISLPAAAITVDGNLSDWNVSVVDYTASCSTNNAASCHNSNFSNVGATPGFMASFSEDTNDKSNSYTVGPNGGGQNYDVEFMAAAIQGTTMYLAISSGQRPDNGKAYYSPGDIRIVANGTTKFGIEVGGGVGGGSGSTITEGASGTTYNVNSNGYTNTTTPTLSTNSAQDAGTIWKDVTWILDPIANPYDEVQFQINGGSTQLGTADYVFTRNDSTTQHSFIELSFDLTLLLGSNINNSVLSITWSPSCGNDIGIVVVIPQQGDVQVPAPAAMSLFLLGLGGLAAVRRRRRAA